jgi:hypothetical protein
MCKKRRRLVQHLSWKRYLGIIKASVGAFEERHFKQRIGIGNKTKCNNGRINISSDPPTLPPNLCFQLVPFVL